MSNKIEFKKISHDVNGNPRYIVHFKHLLKQDEFKAPREMDNNEACEFISLMKTSRYAFKVACKRAKKIGGKRYRAKSHDVYIAFQSYNIHQLEKDINALSNN